MSEAAEEAGRHQERETWYFQLIHKAIEYTKRLSDLMPRDAMFLVAIDEAANLLSEATQPVRLRTSPR